MNYLIKHNILALKRNTHGSVFDTITRDTFDNIEVEIPSLDTQEKVTSVLSDYDEKIELNNAINNSFYYFVKLLGSKLNRSIFDKHLFECSSQSCF